MITLQDLFLFERTGMSSDKRVQGRFRASGIRPKCSEKLASAGFPLSMEMFEQVVYVD